MEINKLNALREKIELAIVSAKSKGYSITAEDWGCDFGEIGNLCCCPLGSVIIQNNKPLRSNDSKSNRRTAADVLGLTLHEIDVFTSAYDHDWKAIPDKADPDIIDLAQEIREKYFKELSIPDDFED